MKSAKTLPKQGPAPDLGQHVLLTYYRDRIEQFERDRVEWYGRLDKLRIKPEHSHRVEWELKKRQEERQELERAL